MNDPKKESSNIDQSFDEVFTPPVTPPSAEDANSIPEPPTPPKKRSFFSERYKWPRRIFLGAVVLGGVAFLAFMISISFDLPPLEVIENPQSDLSTQLISADGVVLQKYYSRENRVNVSLDQMSPFVTEGLVATEDLRFEKHLSSSCCARGCGSMCWEGSNEFRRPQFRLSEFLRSQTVCA